MIVGIKSGVLINIFFVLKYMRNVILQDREFIDFEYFVICVFGVQRT